MAATLQQNTAMDHFRALFREYEANLNGHSNHPSVHFRKAAFAKLTELDFPTRRDEDWKYIGVNRMVSPAYQQGKLMQVDGDLLAHLKYSDLDAYHLVFVNGVFDESRSDLAHFPKGVTAQTVTQAMEDDTTKAWITSMTDRQGGTAQNTFLPLNHAFAKSGLFFDIPAKTELDKPVHILYLSTPSSEPHFASPQLFVRAGNSSQATFIESYQGLEDGTYFNNAANYFDVAANADVHHYRLQEESNEAFNLHNTIVVQDRDSRYSNYAIDLGGRMVRNNLSAEHCGPNIETNLYGIYLGNESQHIDTQTFIDHAVPHCQSNEKYKGILTDRSRGVFNGKVMVRQDAQKTNAYQQNSSLVLSPNAIMDAKPQLEIYADDVRCSHGATVGQLDETAVFYLRSRGLSEAGAKNLLQQAFLGEVLDHFNLKPIVERMEAAIEAKLNTAAR